MNFLRILNLSLEIGEEYMITDKDLPILFKNKEDCCGCGACEAICSAKAITMITDSFGFKYPQIDPKICKRCLLCIKACRRFRRSWGRQALLKQEAWELQP